MQPSRVLLIILMLLTALGETSTQLLIPALGELERGLNAKPGSSLLALSLFVGAFGLGQLLLGPLSDRLGRRPVLLTGLSLYLLATLGMLLAPNIEVLIGMRVLQGLGACAALVLARAIVRDVWQEQAGPVLALTVLGMFAAIVLSPVVGGLLTQYGGWRAPLLVTVVLGSLALLSVFTRYRESHLQRDPQAGRLNGLWASYRQVWPSCRALALTIACTYGSMFVVVAGSSSVYIGLLGLSAAQYGLTFALIVSGLLGGALFTLRNVQRLGPQRVVGVGVALVLLGSLLTLAIYLLFGLSLLGLSLPQVLVTLGGGMLLPAAVAGAVIPNPQRAGLAAGLMGFSQMAGATLAGLLLGALQDGSAWPMVALNALFAVLAFLFFHLLRTRPVVTAAVAGKLP
ncbi:Bcr/CflA family efflux MFS transporter [Pseudomonas berkeleyensis]|uniref:Bcr/CflA family efflux transporter n=1 Tax=Pseudomonas berkeleyensis TaxID=2726956 RepID=A0A7G5DSH3_9PSED|nr:Bcr/CflA family efflux MFS transporter [Pseudomonas berkeleyensis]QMV64698.1 Bcr/CflA family efflux MFS transporter [Pseudomonas berkeleyensis]WSO40166.1 Bcr/CflA family efflux MFS transporter [Pseudomonas berkeleyensis]